MVSLSFPFFIALTLYGIMMDTTYYSIGKFVAAFGVQGELILKHSFGRKTDLKGLQVLFVEVTKGNRIPYFVTKAKGRTADETLVVLEGILNREQAMKLNSREVFLSEADFQRLTPADTPLALLGFDVIDQGKNLGPIAEIIEQPMQMLARLDIEGKEVLIPLHQDTLLKVDRLRKQVHVALPDGLLDIYLG